MAQGRFLGLPYDWRRPTLARVSGGALQYPVAADPRAQGVRLGLRDQLRGAGPLVVARLNVSRETRAGLGPTDAVASFGSAWAPSTRSRTRRAGSARRPPRSTWPRAS